MTIIISIRSSHTDPFAAQLVTEGIKYLAKNFPHIPLALCHETDPNETLNEKIDGWKKKIDSHRSRFPNQEYTEDEEEHDKAIFRLLQGARLFKINYVPTDLKDITKIPLGNPKAEELKEQREDSMVAKLIQSAEKFAGIIFDFGGINHTSHIQKKLLETKSFIEQGHQIHFFCVYSKNGAKYIPAELRLMQFQKENNELYPLGLHFLTTSLQDKAVVLAAFQVKLKTFAQHLEANPSVAIHPQSIENTNMKVQSTTLNKTVNALCLAARDGKVKVLEELLNTGIDPNACVSSQWTALHYACATGQFEAAKLLIQFGANTSKQTEKGSTPIDLGLSKEKLTQEQIEELKYLESIYSKATAPSLTPLLINQFNNNTILIKQEDKATEVKDSHKINQNSSV